MRKLIPLLLAYLAYLTAPTANASLLGCFDCSVSQSKTAAINEYNASGQSEAFIEVIDFKNNIVRSYTIEYDPEFRQTMVIAKTPTTYAKAKAAEQTKEYEIIRDTIGKVNHTSTKFDSAYSIVRDNRYLAVTNEYMSQTNFIEKVDAYGGMLVGAIGKIVITVNVVVEIGFPDGSKIKFKITGIDADHAIVFEVVAASDSENNNIPLTKANVTGRYQFSKENGNWDRFGNLAEEGFGISLSDWASLFEEEVNGTPVVIICDKPEECKSVN